MSMLWSTAFCHQGGECEVRAGRLKTNSSTCPSSDAGNQRQKYAINIHMKMLYAVPRKEMSIFESWLMFAGLKRLDCYSLQCQQCLVSILAGLRQKCLFHWWERQHAKSQLSISEVSLTAEANTFGQSDFFTGAAFCLHCPYTAPLGTSILEKVAAHHSNSHGSPSSHGSAHRRVDPPTV